MKQLFAVIFACLLPMLAFALPTPSEVDAAYNSGNYLKAESMLNEVMKVHPSAKAHFRLGEVYMRENRHKEALNEFRQAQVLDPSLSFCKSAEIFNRLVTNEQAIVTGAGSVVAATPATQVAVIQAKSEAHQQEVTHTFSWLIILLLVIGAAIAVFVVLNRIAENRRQREAEETAEKQRAKLAREQLETFVDLNNQLDDASLICKTSAADSDTKARIQARIGTLHTTLVELMSDAKKNVVIGDSRLYTIKTNVKEIVEAANSGDYPAPVPKTYPYVTATPTPAPTPASNSYSSGNVQTHVPTPGPKTVVHNHYHTPAPTPAPTVVVQNSNNDLLTGVIIGEELAASRRETRVVEEVYVPAPAPYVSRRNDDDDYPRTSSSSSTRSWDDDSSSSASSTSSWDDSRSSSRSSDSWSSSSSSSSSDSWSSSSSSSSSDSGWSSSDSSSSSSSSSNW
jgi:tetratricopeptide (TPR) repeat protein